MHIPFLRFPAAPWRRSALLSEQTVGWGSLFITIAASSTYNGFAKDISSALSPLSLLVLSQMIITLIVLLSFGTLPSLARLARVPRKTWPPLLMVGVLSGVIAPYLWFTGLEYSSAVNSALFGKMEMVFMLLLAFAFLREQWTRAHVIGGMIIVAGIALIVTRGASMQLSLRAGDALILLSSFVYAVGSMIFRTHLHGLGPELVILWRSLTGIAAFFLLSPFLPNTFAHEIAAFPPFLIPALLGFCFIAQFVNVFTFYQAIDRLPIATVSLFVSLEIIGAALFAHWYLTEPLYWYHALGGGLILLGTIALEMLGTHPSEKHLEEHLAQERSNA